MARVLRANRTALIAGFVLFSALNTIGQQPAASRPAEFDMPGAHDSVSIIPGDILDVHVLNLPELDQLKVRVTDAGEVPLLVIGPVKVDGLTPGAAAETIAAAYMDKHLLRNAHVSVILEDSSYAFHAATVFGYVGGVSTTGAANGVSVPIPAPRPLVTVLAMAGGLSDRASRTVTIQRRDSSIKPFKVFIPTNAELVDQPMIYPGDIIDVPRAGIVYILGDVGAAHGVVMQEDGKISIMQALSQAGSTLPTAGLSKIMVFRREDGQYKQIQVDVGKIAKGKNPDIDLVAEDVVWVPFSYGKNLLVNGASIIAAVGSATASGVIIYH